MKKMLFNYFKRYTMRAILFLFMFTSYTLLNAQCNPSPLYADSAWGIWPNPTTNFSPGDVGVAYSQTIDFKIPSDAGLIDPQYSGQTIDSIILNDVTNLPSGLSYSCNNSSCSWFANGAGCAEISGIPASVGSYQISLDVTAWTTVFGLIPFPVDYPFDGYIINIGSVGINSYGLHNNTFKLENAVPNPSNNSTRVQFICGKEKQVQFNLKNILGESIIFSSLRYSKGVNEIFVNTSELKNGIYLYSISDGVSNQTKRLVVNH
jgi:hypothetical protein